MKKSLFFKQLKPTTVKVLGVAVFVILGILLFTDSGKMDQLIVLGMLSLVLLGYSISYEITKNFNNKKHFRIFGVTVFKQKLKCIYPEYITVFSASFKQGAEWGPVAAMGKDRKQQNFVIRFFNGNKYFTVFRANSLQKAKESATELSAFLNVELRGKN